MGHTLATPRFVLRLFLGGFFLLSSLVPLKALAGIKSLNQGHWVRVTVERSGLYRISFDALRKAGFSDPEKVGVYGYGGKLLSEKLSEIPTERLPQVGILRDGEAIYFWGQGPLSWHWDPAINGYLHTSNHYSRYGHYLLSDTPTPGPLLLSPQEAVITGAPSAISHFHALYLHEKELYSLLHSGRRLVGESLMHGIKQQVAMQVSSRAIVHPRFQLSYGYVALPTTSGRLQISQEGRLLQSDEIHRHEDRSYQAFLAGIYHRRSSWLEEGFSSTAPLEIAYSPGVDPAYLDYVALTLEQKLSYQSGQQLLFRLFDASLQSGLFTVEDFPSDGVVLRISPTGRVEQLKALGTGAFKSNLVGSDGQPFLFTVCRLSDAYTPLAVTPITEGINPFASVTEPIDLVIISTKPLLQEAQRLADFHRKEQGLSVLVATEQQLFDAYNGGTPDATAYRLMLKSLDDQRSSKFPGLLQLLLFGDGAVDNRLLSSEWNRGSLTPEDLLLTYQSINSLNIYSYTTDDYFGYLDPADDDKKNGQKRLKVAIGRFPVRVPSEARGVVDKTIRYALNKEPGSWKLRAGFVADNADGYGHLRRAEALADLTETLCPELSITKVYLDAFPKKNVNGLTTFPQARRKLMEALNNGLLFINYTGHGNPAAWADEQVLNFKDIVNFRYTKLPLWITATCDFANYDHPNHSAGEQALTNPISGAVALFSTSRVVLDIDNQAINLAMLRSLFANQGGTPDNSLGHVICEAKNAMSSSDTINKLNFMLLGDPALRLSIPTRKAMVATINGKTVQSGQFIEAKAMEKVSVEGSIQDLTGSVDGDFSGQLFVTIFDSKQKKETLKENIPNGQDETATFYDFDGLIYAGLAQVEKGYFSFSFVVPKDVTYSEMNSRISLYAFSPDTHLEAMGVEEHFRIAKGASEDTVDDTTPPEIRRCYLNSPDLASPFLVGATPVLVADIFDASGINLSASGVGHAITLSIDQRPDLTFELGQYYTADATEAGLGRLLFTLPALSEGDHTAQLTVWDIFNNATTHTFAFRVHHSLATTIGECVVYPSPVAPGNPVTIQLQTSSVGETLEAEAELIDFTGQVVARSPRFTFEQTPHSQVLLRWTPLNSWGLPPSEGLYLFRTIIWRGGTSTGTSTCKLVVKGASSPQ